ncbi:MAG: hypothetical protein MJE12_04255 [Alphaproteobacteria bacterium]|nr:hypothetical protein [Alphaproteobacteria bacterium]
MADTVLEVDDLTIQFHLKRGTLTAVDGTFQATILELIQSTIERFHTSLICITHNLGVNVDVAASSKPSRTFFTP